MQKSSGGVSLQALASELVALHPTLHGDGSVRVTRVVQDSRNVAPGDLFVARPGGTSDGARFVPEALRRGAVAVLVERGSRPATLDRPVIEVEDAARAIGLVAEAVLDHPSRSIRVTGVTGTNGKTTTAWILAHLIEAAGGRPARLGTLGYVCGNDRTDDSLTTPPADEVSGFAARARDAGATDLVMEVSSHALDQARVDAIRFACGVFTNLTQDHLDYHASMREYGEAKARLFTALETHSSVIRVDDPFGSELARRARGRVLRVGRDETNDVYPRDVMVNASGIRGSVATPDGDVSIASRLSGRHNLDNLLVGLAAIVALGFDVRQAAEGLAVMPPVPGRLERCDEAGDDVIVLVDYAHTPDALKSVLRAVRPLTAGRVLCVFGCGGDRDPDKRPKMGAAVGTGADMAIVTNDNPRSEDPTAIAGAILPGLRQQATPFRVVLDRAEAISSAVLEARAGDVVLIAGKGHEPYQIVGRERLPFDDRQQARRALAARRRAAASDGPRGRS